MFDVVRNFQVDYIYFDLLWLVLLVGVLVWKKQWLVLAAFFVGGLGINFLFDYGWWLHSGIREVVLPFGLWGFDQSLAVLVFFLWFSLSYGVEYAFVFWMFQKPKKAWLWVLALPLVWLSVSLLSHYAALDDRSIETIRHMGNLRVWRVVVLLIGYGVLYWKKVSRAELFYIFFLGFWVHFSMEASLWLAGIRPGALGVLIENSLIEFNMGMPWFYIIYKSSGRFRGSRN